jgi:hypothetical protein
LIVSSSMPGAWQVMDYRVYHLDRTGKIIGAHVVNAADDEQALALVREEEALHDCEVWRGTHLVGKVVRSAEASVFNW